MKKSSIPYDLKTEYYLPERILIEKDTINSSVLFEDRPRQCGIPVAENCFLLKAGGYILLDFGKELQGGLLMSTQITKGAKVHIVFGESAAEALSELGEKNSVNAHGMRDYTIEVGCMATFETGNTGFRFVKISSDKDLYFHTIQAACKMRELEYIGDFECDDEILNKIWKTGAYTIHLNMQEYIWDGIKRDRLVWIGDLHPEMSTILSVFGDVDCIRKTLDIAALDLKNTRWLNTIPSYSMWWLINQYDLYVHSRDEEYLKSNEDTAFYIIQQILDEIDGEGNYNFDNKYFVDWSSRDTVYEKAGFNAVLIRALKTGINLCEILDNELLKFECIKKLNIVMKNKFEYSGNKQVTAINYLSGTVDEEEAKRILLENGAENLSCFMGFYVLTALAEMNCINEVLDIIKEYWGGMLKMGATTFWEDFDIKWLENSCPIDEIPKDGEQDVHGDNGKFCYMGFRHSLCHGWASGPTAILSKYILGVYIEEPMFKKVRISPQLGMLKYAKGSFPTPYGKIEVEHHNINGKVTTKVSAPTEIEIVY